MKVFRVERVLAIPLALSLLGAVSLTGSLFGQGEDPGGPADILEKRSALEQRYPDIQFNWPEQKVASVPQEGGEPAYGEYPQKVEERRRSRKAYTLGPSDVIRISVRDHPEFSGEVQVGLSGEIVLPLTNDVIMAEGMTVEEIRQAIEEKLTAYVEQPFVSVFVTEYNSKRYYILGEIGAGIYPIGDTSITLMDALYAAGLPIEGAAAMRRVQIITPHETHPRNRWVNVYAILYKGKMKDNIVVEPGTIIYVPTTMLRKFSRFVAVLSETLEDLADIPADIVRLDRNIIAFEDVIIHGTRGFHF